MGSSAHGLICFSKKIGFVFGILFIAAIVIGFSYVATSQKTNTQTRAAVPPPKQPTPQGGYIKKTILTFDELEKKYGDRISKEEKLSMNKYVNPRIVVWHTSPTPDFSMNTIVLGGGLSSNSTQWEKGTGLVTRVFSKLHRNALQTSIIAIECPGFGNAEIKKELITEETVSSRTYARDYWTWVKLLGLNPEKTILSGHSSGGEAVLMLSELSDFNPEFKIFALNPAVHVDISKPFTEILLFEDISYAVKNYLDEVVNKVAHYLTKYYILAGGKVASLTSSDPLVAEQMKIHDEEFKKFDAFWKKSNELVSPDTVDPKNFAKENLTFLFPVGDRLTPGADGVAFIQKYFELTDTDINNQSIRVEDTENFGHDALFYNNAVAEQTAKKMVATLFPDQQDPTSPNDTYNLVAELRIERKLLTQTYSTLNEMITDSVQADLLFYLGTKVQTGGGLPTSTVISSKIKMFLLANEWSSKVKSDNTQFLNAAKRIEEVLLRVLNGDSQKQNQKVVIEEKDIQELKLLRQKIVDEPLQVI